MKNVFFRIMLIALLFSLGKVSAQSMLSQPLAEDPVHFANRNFEAGTLTVTVTLPSATSTVTITFPTGIEYVASSLHKVSGTPTISHVGSSPAGAPKFTISGAGTLTFTIKRKVTKAALAGLQTAGTIFKDNVEVTSGGGVDAKDSNQYTLPIPNIVVQLAEPTHNNASGSSVKTFGLRNTGNGTVKEIYFSVKYPNGVTGNELTYNGTAVPSVGTVPSGVGKNTGATLYRIVSATGGFKLNDEITITEKYTVKGCQPNRQIVYEAYWGENASVLYQARDRGRAINVTTGTPNIVLDINYNNSYFEWRDGLCGTTLGTFTAQYINKGSGNATAYDLQMNITPYLSDKGFKNHIPANFRIVATDGTEIPINSMTPTTTQTTPREIPFKDLAALSATALAGKDIGLTDVDGDGFKDDLPINGKLIIRFDMIKNQSIVCLQNDKGTFSVSPHSKFTYKDACGTERGSAAQALTNNTFRRLLTGISDNSKFPASLSQNNSVFGYLSFGHHTIISQHIAKGIGIKSTLADARFRYEIVLPAGVELKNVKFYKGNGFGQSTVPPTVLPNVPKGGTLSYTTTDGTKGYITFDMLLTTPCTSGDVPLQYAIYYLDKNGTTNTYCEFPLICNNTQIATICPGICGTNGPRMLNTKAERADNSYGWTDYTMNTRQTRANVSAIDRSRALHLDDIEIISEGEQGGIITRNLYYHAQVKSKVNLIPKSIAIAVGSNATVTLQASPAIVTSGTYSDTKYFRWNLSSTLPSAGIAVGQKFRVIATYQVNNPNTNNNHDNVQDTQVGSKTFFYMLDNPSDNAIATEGYHTNARYCGAKLTPPFYIAETYKIIGTNPYNIKGCEVTNIGTNQVYLARRFGTAGTYYMNEFRPTRRIKTLKIIIPSSYNMAKPVEYSYLRKSSEWVENDVLIPVANFTMSNDGTYKTYTYINPAKGAAGYLNPGNISVENAYGETIRTWLQATCDSKIFQSTTQASADNQMAKVEIDFEDFYYHYADKTNRPVQKEPYEEWIRYSEKPAINLLTETPQNVTANQRTQTVDFRITNTSVSDAPYGWISVPDVTGVKVLSLVELNNSGSAVRTFTAQNISGEKMYFLSEGGSNGTIAKNADKRYRLEYQITNCNDPNLTFDVYAGWNCNENPTQGYRRTCHDQKITYNVKIAKSLKQIRPSASNPGESSPDKVGSIPMCQKTKYEYTVNSGDEGDLFDAKLVIVQETGITISDVTVEYPLNSNNYYTQTSTPAIGFSQSGNKLIYDLSAILPNKSLPGAITEPAVLDKRNLKLTFNVQPSCQFTAGSSFDVDIEGNNLCGNPAEGDKTKVIIAGIAGIDTNKYKVNNQLVSIGGNANACATSYAEYKGKHQIIDLSPGHNFQTNANGLVVIRIPEGFEYVAGSFTPGNKSQSSFADAALATPPTKVIGTNTELSIKIPSGMKHNDYFEYTIKVKQKANTPIANCALEKKLQYYTTDTVEGVVCQSGTTCPPVVVETTTKRGEVAIPLERADLVIKNVQLSSVAEGNKEKVTVQYAVQNTATATVSYTGDLKVSLYDDTNNNGIVEEAIDNKLQDFTLASLVLAPGATVTKTETILLDQSKLCRLYLSIRNTFNPCLCNDKVVAAPAPTTITGLVATVTACEIGKTNIVYNTQAPTYERYTWEAVTAGDLAHLSDANIKEPVFSYAGANITTTKTITYLLKVKRTNACEATQTVTVLVTPAPNAPTVTTPQYFCAPATALDLKLKINATATNAVKVYSAGVALTDTDTLQDGIYQVSLVQSSGCESEKANVTVSVTVCNIVAKDDLYKPFAPITTATITGNVLTNDKVGGVTATTATVDITNITSAGPGIVPIVKTNGDVEVPANTPVGEYKISYRICAKANPADCSTATVTVVVIPRLEAKPDDLGTIAGLSGGTTTATVFENDLRGTTPINPSEVNLTWGTAPAHIATNTNGTITVLPNTPAGTYTISYTICEKDNPTNCSTAIATVKVVTLKAVNDGVKTLPKTGGSVDILANDIYGAPTGVTSVTTANTTLTITYNSGITGLAINPNGTLQVPASAPAGSYNVEYRICTTAAPVICDTATLTIVKQAEIIANDDSFAGVVTTTEYTIGNVLNNPPSGSDTLDGNQATVGNVALSVVTPAAPSGTVPYINITTGGVVVPAGTPANTYTITYKICEKDLSGVPTATTNCDVATVTVNIYSPTTVEANPDTFTYSGTGTQTVGNVLTNDTVSGTTSATTSNVTISQVSTPTGAIVPRIDTANGNVIVPNNTLSGIYTLTYQICTVATPTACATTTVEVTVPAATPTPTVEANPDTFIYTGTGTQTIGNVLTNDTVSGTTSATTSNVTISQVSTPTGAIVPRIDTTNGNVIVPNNTPSGIYTLTYQICTVATPTACATATVEVTVPAVTPTPTVQATPDEFTYSGTGTQTVGNVLTNDTVSGTTSATTSNVTISQVSTPTGAIVPRIDTANGNVIVPNNTPSGIYTLTYQICTVATPTACATATVEVTVPAVTPTPTVQATPDEFTYSGTGTQTVGNVLTNDTVSGTTSATTSNVTISQVSTPTGAIVPRIDTTNGNVIVPNNTPAGIYTLTYQICTVATPTACATTTVEVTVPAVTPTPTVQATPDEFTYSGTGTQTVGNVLTNDTVSGTTSATTSNVTISQVSTPTGAIVPRIDTTNGNVIVPNNTPSGIYTLTYQICTVATPTACATATVEVTVPAATPTPTVEANPDTFTYTGTGTQTVGNVLTNDTVSGTTSATTSNVTISQVSTPTGAIVPRIDTTNGNVIVPNNTPAGIYTLTYQICTVATPTACATTTVEVTVPAVTPTPTVQATPDEFTYSGTGTQTVGNVLTNDTVSGTTSATTSNVTISQVSTPTGAIVPRIDTTNGNVIVPNNTPSGIYTLTYQICTVATPTACATTTVEVTVPAATPTPTVEANPDTFTYTGTGTQTIGNVLTNDTVSGTTSATTSNVTISQVSTPTGAIVPRIDTTNGNVIVPNNTPSGIYTITYQICTVATPTACATTTVEVTVPAATPTPTVEANPDTFTYTGTGTQTVGNVLTNDTVSGTTSATISNVTISQVSTPTGSIVPRIDTTNGNVIVPNNTPSGIYTITYQICTVATPTACATATVEVTVSATTTSTTPVLPIAADDRTTTPIDTPVAVNVLANDTPNGATAPNVVTNPTNGTTVVNPDGTIEYRPHTGFVGIDTFVYELCNTDGCASATVTIEVVNKLVPYNGMSVDGDGKNEHFHIAGINRYPDNVVRIYNRWGVKVFETEGYDNVTRVFRGFSNGRVVVETSDKLPQGTYYYVIEYVDENKQKQSEVGWLYIKR